MKIGDPFPGFAGATDWLNGTGEDLEASLKGFPLLVHFWATSCGICKENMPGLHELTEKYIKSGLKTVSVHMPLSEAETDPGAVLEALDSNGISELCAIDNLHSLKKAFKNEHGWVPVYYLFDPNGKLKTRAAGKFGVGILKSALERMFKEVG